jgi:hypothetical protein
MRIMSEKLYKDSIESINKANELLKKQNDELIKLRKRNRELYKLVCFIKHENKQECTMHFEIEYEYKHSTQNSTENKFLKFTYKSEHGDIPLSGSYDELMNKFAWNEN